MFAAFAETVDVYPKLPLEWLKRSLLFAKQPK